MQDQDRLLNPEDLEVALGKILARSSRKKNGCLIWQGGKTGEGYGTIRVCGKTHSVHRLIYAAFIKDPGTLCVCHSCDNPVCVNPDHLWLGTDVDNMRDRDEKGRNNQLSGEDCPWAKLKSDDVLEIRRRYNQGSITHGRNALAREFQVSHTTIQSIVNRITWRHI